MPAATAAPGGHRRLSLDAAGVTASALRPCLAIVGLGLAPGYLASALALACLGLTDQDSIRRAFLEGAPGPAAAFLAVGLVNLSCRFASLGALFSAIAARAEGEALGPVGAFDRAWRDLRPNLSAAPAALRLVLRPRRDCLGRLAAAALLAAVAHILISNAFRLFWSFCEALFSGEPSVLEGLIMSFISDLAGGLVLAWLLAFSVLLHRDLAGLETPS